MIYSSRYDNGKIALLRQLLMNRAQNGRPAEYEIKVDEFRAVPRTTDPALFDNYEQFFFPGTEAVIITIYEGQGMSGDKHIFTAGGEKKPPETPALSGVDIDKKVDEKVNAIRQQMAYEKLEEQNKTLATQLKEAEAYIEELEQSVELEKLQRLKVKGIHLGEIVSVAGETLIRRNPHWLSGIPGIEGLAGLIAEDNKKKEKRSPEHQGEATYSELGETEELTEEEKELLSVLRGLEEDFNETELLQLRELLELLIEEKPALSPALELVRRIKNSPPKKEDERRQSKPGSEENKEKAGEGEQSETGKEARAEHKESIPDAPDADSATDMEEGIPVAA